MQRYIINSGNVKGIQNGSRLNNEPNACVQAAGNSSSALTITLFSAAVSTDKKNRNDSAP